MDISKTDGDSPSVFVVVRAVMDWKEKVRRFAANEGVIAGFCGAEADEPLKTLLLRKRQHQPQCGFEPNDLDLRTNPSLTLSGAKSILVCLFPYFRSDIVKQNLSRYACIPDYHVVVRKKLEKISEYIRQFDNTIQYKCYSDNGPLVDRYLAYKAGLGFFGQNCQFIHDTYGSWCFIGYSILTADIPPDKPLDRTCAGCGKCREACPGGALDGKMGFDCERCISYLTQKGELTDRQAALLTGQDSVYGCDVCQEVCPHNEGVPNTPVQEFYGAKLEKLEYNEVNRLSEREFKRKFKTFPFAWRGKSVILRNLEKEMLDK